MLLGVSLSQVSTIVNVTFDSDVLEGCHKTLQHLRLIYSSRFLSESTKLSSDGVSVVGGGGVPLELLL